MGKKTIVLTTWRRPEYTRRVVSALNDCRGIDDWDLLVHADYHERRAEVVDAVMDAWLGDRDSLGFIQPSSTFGVARAPTLAMQFAFGPPETEFILKIEDDAVLSRDALLLADWYLEACRASNRWVEKYALMCMGWHEDKGPNPPELLREFDHITMPFAFCLHVGNWPFIQKSWNRKILPPTGWDWSLSYALRVHRKLVLAPRLSRCENIGRDSGVHDTNETFDQMQLGVPHSDGRYRGGHYWVERADHNPNPEFKMDEWMLPEYESGNRP